MGLAVGIDVDKVVLLGEVLADDGDGQGEGEEATVRDKTGGNPSAGGGGEESGVAKCGGINNIPIDAHYNGCKRRLFQGRVSRIGPQETTSGKLHSNAINPSFEIVHD